MKDGTLERRRREADDPVAEHASGSAVSSSDDDLGSEEPSSSAASSYSGSGSEEGSDSDASLAEGEDGEQDTLDTPAQPGKGAKPITLEDLTDFQSKVDKTGVVYLSRIPPFMRPSKLRQLLSQYAPLGRIYLVPEDAKVAARRKKYRHNKRPNYVEGWVEFQDKGQARAVAQHLNNHIIGGKKRSYYHDDMWNIKYLPKFKWHHLTEQMAYELKVREQKVAAELAQAKRETSAFLTNVAKARMIEGMEEKRKRKAEAAALAATDGTSPGLATSSGAEARAKVQRRFKQRRVVEDGAPKVPGTGTAPRKQAVLSKLFSG